MPERSSPSSDIRVFALRLAAQGVALVLLRERSKRPVLNNWTTLPRMSASDVSRRYSGNQNIGIRLGEPSQVGHRRYVHGIDMDIRVARAADECWNALLERFPEAETWPCVVSGSGGESRHLYIVTDSPFRKVNIARSSRKVRVKTADGIVEKSEWEIDFYGTGAQMVLPPSVHPDTGKAYRWVDGEPDFTNLPFIRQTVIQKLFGERHKKTRNDLPTEPIDNLAEILDSAAWDNEGAGLDYDKWCKVLFAVKHEYEGTDEYDEAFELVEEWSQRSDKHDQKRFEEVWEHAGRTNRSDAVTLGTLKKAAAPELAERRKDRIVASMVDERSAIEKQAAEDGVELPDEWLRRCVHGDDGAFSNCADNRVLYIENYDSMRHLVWSEEEQRPVWRRPENPDPSLRSLVFPEGAKSMPFDPKTHYQVLQMCLRKPPFRLDTVKKEEINDSVWLASQKRPWKRILEMLTREKWDGVSRIDTLLQDYLGVEDSAYARDVSRLLLLGPMCRVLWRGVKVDYSPILQGPQGAGKDRFLELLCTFDDECLYTATSFDIKKPSEYVQSIRGKLIVHMAEMATFRRSSNEDIKTFLTEHEDTARLSYEAISRTYRRLCVFVFSVNETGDYLTDNTGNRRFLPVVLGDPKQGKDGKPTAYRKSFAELEKVRGQLWAEARVRAGEEADRQGGRVREILLSPEALVTARRLQLEKMTETPEQDLIARGLRLLEQPVPLDDLLDAERCTEDTARKMAKRNQITPREFWSEVLGERKDNWYRNSQIVSRALNALPGWTRCETRQRHKGEIRVVYRRDGTDGKPEIYTDIEAPPKTNVFNMADERRNRRRNRDD